MVLLTSKYSVLKTLHAFVKIILLIALLLIVNLLNVKWVVMLCIILCALAMLVRNSQFLRVLIRMRWLWLSLLLIYALSTPGEYIMYFPSPIEPTFEGVEAGVLQIFRLCTAIACLHLLFSTSKKEDLLVALYYLLTPLKWLGFNVEQFAARLFLTLDYVEEIATQSKVNIQFLQLLHQPMVTTNEKPVEIQQLHLMWSDKLAIFTIVVTVISMYYIKFTQ